MFSKDVNLDKLVNLENVDVAVQLMNLDFANKRIVAQATGTIFRHTDGNEKVSSQVVKKMSVAASGETVEEAQDKALLKLQGLLGV